MNIIKAVAGFRSLGRAKCFLLVCCALLALSGCAGKPSPSASPGSGDINLTFWHTLNREETLTLEPMIAEFERREPDIKIKAQAVPFDQAQNKFKTAAQADNAPDILRSEIGWTCEQAALGFLTPLQAYLSPAELKDYLPGPLGYNYYQGCLYGLPQVTDCLALLYNRRMLAQAGLEPPRDLQDFIRVGQKLTLDRQGHSADQAGFNPAETVRYGFYFPGKAYWFQTFIWLWGGNLLDLERHKILINQPAAVQAFDYLLQLRDKYHVIPPNIDLPNAYDNMMAGFKAGSYAMIFNGPWSTADILSGSEFRNPQNLGIGIIPKGPGGYASPIGGHNYVISSSCRHPREAYRFIAFLNEPRNQARWAITNNLLPTRLSAYALPELQQRRIIQEFKAQLMLGRNRPVLPQGALLYIEFDPNVQAAWLGDLTPREALDNIADSWEKMLNWKE